MMQSSDFEIGDVVRLLSSATSYGAPAAHETATVLCASHAPLLQLQFGDGRTEDHPARLAMLMSRPRVAR